MIIPVILAGGSGTRLWPLSRELYPKQLLPLVGKLTLLQNTLARLDGFDGLGAPIVICNENHRFLVAEQLRQLDVTPAAIILEPVGRNTAPAVAVAALHASEMDRGSSILVLPADHHIGDVQALQHAIGIGGKLAKKGLLATFGIVPHAPETGYGYIRKGNPVESNGEEPSPAFSIKEFVEKPDLETALRYVQSGEYLWNSGMFVFPSAFILEELSILAPEILKACRNSYGGGRQDLDFFRLNDESFCCCPGDSIDYAIMEKTQKGVVIPLESAWNDLGSWEALSTVQAQDSCRNVMVGDVLTHDVEGSYIHATSRLVAAVGLQNHVVVETADAVLVAPRNRVQDVKLLVQQLKEKKRDEAVLHRKVFRPWGSYESLNAGDRFQVKRITVKPGARLSLQKHHHRAEHWVVVHGTALVTRNDEHVLLKEDESIYIPLGATHRLENPGKIPLELIEVQSGSYLGEDDIVRMDDVYGRKNEIPHR